MPKYNEAADYNNDKKVTKKEQARYDREQKLTPDTLSETELAKKYGYALRVIESDPELLDLFKQAANGKKGQWTAERFTAELMNTDWWMNNSEFARKGLTLQALGGADWDTALETARIAVQERATTLGVSLDDTALNQLAEDAIMNGWDQPGRTQLLDNALSSRMQAPQQGEFMAGDPGRWQQVWQQTAAENGLQFSNDWFASNARSVASGLMTAEEVERGIREQAASLYQPFADKILGGQNMRQIAGGYLQMMADTFEVDPEMISLNDPMIQEALLSADDNGQPSVESLWSFQQRLRQDPRWMKTQRAGMEVAQTARSVMEIFGLVG